MLCIVFYIIATFFCTHNSFTIIYSYNDNIIIMCAVVTMTTPMCEDGGPLREWAPLAILLQQIPAKIQNGIFTQDISFTCIAALPEFIAIGTNHGLIYWFNREKQDLQRLRCEVLAKFFRYISLIKK